MINSIQPQYKYFKSLGTQFIDITYHPCLTNAFKEAMQNSVFCGTNLNSEFFTHSLLEDNKLSFLDSIILQMLVLFCNWQYYIQGNASFAKQKNK